MKKSLFGFPVWVLILWVIALTYHLFAAGFSPMPWFDETYFASMASHFSETGDFYAPVCPLMDYYYPQSKAYGPGYFLLLASVIKLFGFGMMQIRIPGIIMGFGFLLVGHRLLKENGNSVMLGNLFFLLLLFDPIFLQKSHSGRMDSMALLMSGLGTLFILRGARNSGWKNHIAGGFFLGLAILTTPRVSVNMVGAATISFFYFLSGPGWKAWWKFITIPIIIIALYSVWVFWGFGDYFNAWNYFFGQPKEKLYYDNLAQGYISFKKYIPPFQFPAILLLLILLISWLFKRRPMGWLFWICLINLAAFYSLVRDTGLYSIFSIPWIYLLIAVLTERLYSSSPANVKIKLICWILVFFNFGLFIFKQAVVVMGAPTRDSDLALQQFSRAVPKGSRVIGDEAFYYIAKENACDFQYLDRGAAGFQRLKYHLEQYNFEYLIVRNPISNAVEFGHYQKSVPLKQAGVISCPPPSPFARRLESVLKLFGTSVPAGYTGIIYKR